MLSSEFSPASAILQRFRNLRRNDAPATITYISVRSSETTPPTQPMSKSLLRRLRNGDRQSWDELTTEWSPRLYRYLRYNLPTDEDAEDALSETLIAAVKSVATFDGNVAVSTWLYSLAHRKMADFWRRTRPTAELLETIAAPPEGADLDFYDALQTLPETTRHVLLLRYRDGLSVDEVAAVIGRTYKATESLLSRGRSQLRNALEAAEQKDEDTTRSQRSRLARTVL